MNGDQIRDSFIKFFEDKGHLHMPSASLIPAGDRTLLFTSAGMVPFKPFFMGEQTPPNRRLTSSQKSFRTTDIDEVGDHKHVTFFEMLGNFSIGDYFKKDAVAFAWELFTQVFQLPPDRLYVTVHLDDDDAFQLWREGIGVPAERIYRYGDKDNWWGPAGTEGPCGPCSEIHYDGGAEKGCGPMVEPDALTALLRDERESGALAQIPGCHPNCDCERFVELWNLVFMQFYQDPQRNRTPLPAPSVDTGLGLERITAVLQGKASVYETDLFWPIVEKACQLSGTSYGVNKETDYALRVVVEHARASSFLIGDGVVPGNEGRGYVLRRIIRRAIRYGRRLGLDEPFLAEVAEVVLPRFRDVYRELLENHDFILRVIRLEEERFGRTVNLGMTLLADELIPTRMQGGVRAAQWFTRLERDLEAFSLSGVAQAAELFVPSVAAEINQSVQNQLRSSAQPALRRGLADPLSQLISKGVAAIREGADKGQDKDVVRFELDALKAEGERLFGTMSGAEIFALYDTYGFPPELTAEIAREHGLEVDMEGFEREMASQREQARAAHGFTGSMEVLTAYENLGVGRTQIPGHEVLKQESSVGIIMMPDPSFDPGRATQVETATQGQQVELILLKSPFYPEGGGQVGDQGTITGPKGLFRVEDTHSPVAGLIVHRGVVERGDISEGDPVTAQVDINRRWDAARNHSGTHLLHASLRSVLGPHVRQAGSLVAPDRLRFDFSHVSPLSPQEVESVQSLANERVRDNLTVRSHETTYSEAVREGALAFFGDRYGDVVRVVAMSRGDPLDSAQDGPFSLEVCGGTHVAATGQVGAMLVLGESSIGGGMRRIEAVTGRAAEAMMVDYAAKLESLARKLQTPVADLETRLDSFIQDTEELRRRLATLERTTLRSEAERILERVVEVEGVKVVAARTSATKAEGMREMGDFLKAKLASAVVVLGAVVNGSPMLVAMVTPDLVNKGLHAGNMVRETAGVMGGSGGGRPEMAQAGGRQAEKLDEALGGVPELVRRGLS